MSDIKYTNFTVTIYCHIYLRQGLYLTPPFFPSFFLSFLPFFTLLPIQFNSIKYRFLFDTEATPSHIIPAQNNRRHCIVMRQCNAVRCASSLRSASSECPSPTPLDKSRRGDSLPAGRGLCPVLSCRVLLCYPTPLRPTLPYPTLPRSKSHSLRSDETEDTT